MSEPNNMNNDYVSQSSYLGDFNANPPIQMQTQSHTQDFLPSASFPPCNVGMTSINTMDYKSTGCQSNPSVSCIHPGNLDTMNGHLNPPSYNQVETHTYQLPVSVQTFCGSSVHRSDMTNNGPTDNHFQHFRTINNRSISYMLTPIPTQAPLSFNGSNVINEPTSPRYFLVTKVEETQSVILAADIGEMLAKLECEKEKLG
ncbi:4856_t:CDS:1 [Paraglomus brasilianum]|uniref:4856_t:CDS:1 n=1 Tax=Paraglomus brasilianum TaxID=144538 RepID=A0A9N9FE63_9GLOM|nr:4856_t:CDS:1 [Paraglomus brasilianum]